VVKTLGTSTAAAAPAAVRVARPGWRDPRLWIGVAIVAACVVAGARLFASADDTVQVWVTRDDAAVGSRLAESDLEVARVRFADPRDLDRYLTADDPVPASTVLTRGLGAGELVPRSALGTAEQSDLVLIPVAVEPTALPDGVGAGSRVDVRVSVPAGEGGGRGAVSPALEDVEVVSVTTAEESFAASGQTKLTLAVKEADQVKLFGTVGRITDPAYTIVLHGG